MTPKLQLPFPRLGVSDDQARAEQPPMTTRRAFNCRLIDPVTRRSRGGQRAGMSEFFTGDVGARIDHLTSISYNVPKIAYTLLDENDNGTTTPALIEAEWAKSANEGFRNAVRVDRDGTLYTLTSDARVLIYNPDGTLIDSIDVPLKEGEVVRAALAVDDARRVYVSAYRPGSPTGYNSRIFQWRRRVDPDDDTFLYYDLAWTEELPGIIGELVAKGGGLWFVQSYATEGGADYTVKYGGLSGDQPFQEWALVTPSPTLGLAVGPTGSVYVSSRANAARGATAGLGGLHLPQRTFLPHDIGWDAAALDNELWSAHRLHAWLDTATTPFAEGAEIAYVQDVRYRDTQASVSPDGQPTIQPPGNSANPDEYGDGPTDTISHPVWKLPDRPGPIAQKEAWATRPMAFFDRNVDPGTGFPGMALRSTINPGPWGKLDTTGIATAGSDTGTDVATTIDAGDGETALPGLSIVLAGATHNAGVLNLHLTARVTFANFGASTLHIRVLRDGVPVSGIQDTSPGNGTFTLQYDLAIVQAADQDGTYTVTFTVDTFPSGGGQEVTVNPGTGFAPAATLYYNETASDQDGLWPDSQAIVPGARGDVDGGAHDNWTAFSAWRLDDPTSGIQVLASQNGNVHKWALLAHARLQSGVLGHAPGWVTLISNQMYGGSSDVVTVPGVPTNGFFNGWHGVSQDSNVDSVNENFYALVTIGISGQTTGQDPESVNTSFMRVNGTPAGRFSIQRVESNGPTSHVLIGNKHAKAAPSADDLFGTSIPFLPFHGGWASWVTMLGGTSDADATANDVPTTYPATGGVPPGAGDASGTINPGGFDTDTPELGTSYTGTATEVERIEGGLAHEWGMAVFLPNGDGSTTGTGGLYETHPFGGVGLPPTGFSSSETLNPTGAILGSPRPILAKIGANGAGVVWALNGSGLGNAVAADDDGFHIVAMGAHDSQDVGSTTTVLRRVFDGGQTYSLETSDGAWTYDDSGFVASYPDSRIELDGEGNVYWPRAEDGTLTKHDVADGGLAFTYTEPSGPGTDLVRQFALEPDVPVYPPATSDADRVPIFGYLGGVQLRKLRLVAETQAIGDAASPRMTRYLAVAGSGLYRGVRGGAASTPTGGSGVFDSTRTYVASAALFSKVYLTDGRNYVVYDPLEDTARSFVSSTRGEPPKRARLMAAWNGRLVMARTQDGPTAWYMSKQGDPTNWEYFPANPTVQDAVNGDSSRGPGRVPDAITALVPLDDSTLLIGCDSAIYALRGDPLGGMRLDSSQGGRLDLLTDETGMAFGRSTTRSPDGGVYFFGQRGGVYRVTASGVQRITQRTIEKRLQDIDLSTYRVELAWDYRAEGPNLYQFEHENEGAPRQPASYHFDAQNGGWWPDSYATTAVQPTAVAVFDGDDPDDRVVALGFHGGEVRFLDPDATSDAGEDIASEVWVGPFSSGLPDAEARFSHLQAVLAADQGGVSWAWYVSDEPDLTLGSPGTAVATGAWTAGLNAVDYNRARGLFVWLRITGGVDETRWAYEGASLEATPGGRARIRS